MNLSWSVSYTVKILVQAGTLTFMIEMWACALPFTSFVLISVPISQLPFYTVNFRYTANWFQTSTSTEPLF